MSSTGGEELCALSFGSRHWCRADASSQWAGRRFQSLRQPPRRRHRRRPSRYLCSRLDHQLAPISIERRTRARVHVRANASVRDCANEEPNVNESESESARVLVRVRVRARDDASARESAHESESGRAGARRAIPRRREASADWPAGDGAARTRSRKLSYGAKLIFLSNF